MKIEVDKAEKRLGFRHLLHLMNLRLSAISEPNSKSLRDEVKKAEEEWDLYQKPGFRKERSIIVVSRLPENPIDDVIYVTFMGDGYAIQSGRNFIHAPIIKYGNLRYASISELEYSKEEVLADLKRLNNGIISK